MNTAEKMVKGVCFGPFICMDKIFVMDSLSECKSQNQVGCVWLLTLWDLNGISFRVGWMLFRCGWEPAWM